MPRSFWDDNVNPNAVTLSPEISSAELAARLGSIDRYHRTGEVLWQDSFEDGVLDYVSSHTLGTAQRQLRSDSARTGAYSLRLEGDNVTSADSWTARRIAPLEISRLGYESHINPQSWLDSVEWRLQVYTGVELIDYRLRYNSVPDTLEVYNSAGSYEQVAAAVIIIDALNLYNAVKLIVDVDLRQYVRVMVNNRVISLAGRDAQVTASAVIGHVRLEFRVVQPGGSLNRIHLDDLILTQNEP